MEGGKHQGLLSRTGNKDFSFRKEILTRKEEIQGEGVDRTS